MKSNKIFIITIILSIFTLSSCNSLFHKDIEPVSKVSIYPLLEFEQGYVVKRAIGDTWTEPGFKCSQVKLGDSDLNDKVVVDASSVDMNTAGYYFISYTVQNEFGYEDVFYRTVVVTDPSASNTDITGNYKYGFTETYMDVTHQGTDNDFYFATNILDKNNTISSTLVNIGDNKYCVPRTWTEYSGGRYVDGFAEFIEFGGFFPSKLYFTLTFTDKDGNQFFLTGSDRTIWTKQD